MQGLTVRDYHIQNMRRTACLLILCLSASRRFPSVTPAPSGAAKLTAFTPPAVAAPTLTPEFRLCKPYRTRPPHLCELAPALHATARPVPGAIDKHPVGQEGI